ncbi:WD40-repeat-containing domain protein, partial [Syncephalis pseudoplumigaleata]
MPETLKSYLLFQLMRRSTLPTVQFVCSYTQQHIRLDFISELPSELALHVISFLDVNSLCRSAQVSRCWRETIDGEPSIWRRRLLDDGLCRTEMEADGKLPDCQLEDRHRTALSPVTGHPYKRRYRRLYLLRANWNSGRARHLTFPAHGSNVVTCLHFDGRRIITGSDDNSVGVWDSATGALLRHMTGHEGGVWALAVCGDTVVSGSTDRSIRVWDIADGRCSHILWGHTSTVRCCKIIMPRRMPNGELCPRKPVIITGSRDATLRVWWLPSPRRDPPWMGMAAGNGGMVPMNLPQADPFLLYSWTGHTGSVRAVDGWGRWVVSGSYDSTVRVWDLLKGECRWRLGGHTQKVYS